MIRKLSIPAVIKIWAAAAVLVAASSVPALSGAAWTANGVPACSVVGPQESPSVAGLPDGGAIVAWADKRGDDYDIYAQRFDASGGIVWPAGGVKICGAAYDQQFPAAVHDGSGGAIVVWQDGRLGDDGLALYAQRISPAGAVLWQTDGVPVFSYAAGLEDPPMAFSHVVASDGAGGVIAAWRDTRSDPVSANTEIYAQKINSAGAPVWTVNGVRLLGFTTLKWATRNPIIAPDGSGGAVVAWQDARNLAVTANDIYAQRVSSSGTPLWAGNGVPVVQSAGEQGYPDIAALPGGKCAIVWEDKRAGNYDIYAQVLDSTGAFLWGADGRIICGSANDQRTPRVCRDGSDGIITAWTDKRAGTLYTDIYAQRLSSGGAPLWAGDGVPVCTAPGSQTRIRMGESVSGYTILTWMDTRNETLAALYDIYGQMIDSNGSCVWNSAGIPVAAITGSNQRLQQAVSGGSGSIYAVWEDDRNAGDWDIYAQKMDPWALVATIGDVRAMPPGSPVAVPARVVTGSYTGFFYIEESDRSSGIRVQWPQGFAPGTMVKVTGTLDFGLEPFIRAAEAVPSGTGPIPGALGVTPSGLGSGSIAGVCGPANVGLLVRTWGTVLSGPAAGQPYMTITDGGRSVRVYCSADVQAGDTVAAAGVCSAETVGPETAAVILTRQSSDVIRINR